MKAQFLKQDLQATDLPQRFVAVMASGMAVRADDPFPWLQQQYHRQTIALDMEAASFYAALRSFTHALVVKGVCDYADMKKNDTYHDYAARVSAVYLLGFLQEYVTEQTMPLQHASERAEAKRDSKPTHIRVVSRPSREGNKGVVLFVLDGTEHALEYIRYDNISHQILFLKEKQQELVRLVVPFATLKPLEKQAVFQIDGVDGLLAFKMSAVTSIMNIKVEVGGVEVFHN